MAHLGTIAALLTVIISINIQDVICARRLSCKNAKGNDVDWFVLYKLPKTKGDNKGQIGLSGGEMLYYDSRTQKGSWSLLPSDMYHQILNPVKETLEPIFGKKRDKKIAYAVYNDQPPPKITNSTRGGHSKGVLMAAKGEKMGVVWLQHSVPKFLEDLDQGYKYPHSGRENAQLFLCISFHLNSVNVIAQHLQIQAANVYMSNAPSWAQVYDAFWRVINKVYLRNPKQLKVDFLKTTKNKAVLMIAKPPNWPKDIYTDELRKHMNDSIIVQSWKNGAGGAQDKYCSKGYDVTDVDTIGVRTPKGYSEFSTREDHSKWYVTRRLGIFCFSSLNRMLSQMKRGGEITCVIDITLSQLFKQIIARRSFCNKEKAEK